MPLRHLAGSKLSAELADRILSHDELVKEARRFYKQALTAEQVEEAEQLWKVAKKVPKKCSDHESNILLISLMLSLVL